MHPAKSVIFFTTASGAGYGLLIWLGLFGALGWLPADRGFGVAAFSLAFVLITAGLLASTFHLGHPERAWRALSQWRSSWLSREGLAAILTYVPAGLQALIWVVLGRNDGAAAGLGIASAVLALLTVYCTAMIYTSLKAVPAWHNGLTVVGYLVLAAMTGSVLLYALMLLFGLPATATFGVLALALTGLGLVVKVAYWRSLASRAAVSTAESATGLGDLGKVGLLEAPHTVENYLMQEMGFQIARKHAAKLRNIAIALGFVVPFAAVAAAIFAADMASLWLVVLAVVAGGIGIATERWLFFAEAKHVVTLYYGNDAA